MGISYEFENGVLTISLAGRLDFAKHELFNEAYASQPADRVKHYVLDMRALTYLDSSALGMLLLLKDYASKSAKISIINCSKDVCKIFEIANFDQLFEIANLKN
jgi:anti-anti-sigma factor